MNTKNIFLSIVTIMMMVLSAYYSEAQSAKQTPKTTSDFKIEVIQ